MKYRTAASICMLAGLAVPALAQQYTFVDLGTFGGTTSFARAVNNLGQVTGNAQQDTSQPAPRLIAFSWSPPEGPLVPLGVLPGSNNFSRGYAINDAGVIVGESDNNTPQAFRWDPINGMTGLIRLLGDNFNGVAHGINNSGVIVGISGNGITSRPTQWSASGLPTDLGSIDGVNTSFGRAWFIHDSGTVVGFSADGINIAPKATMWLGGAGGQIINLLSLLPDSRSEAYAVNSNNVAVGYAVNGSTGGGTPIRRAVRWEVVGGVPQIQELGSLGMTFSEAMDIADDGTIVGLATNILGLSQAAWIYRNGTMEDLNSVFTPPAGWVLTAANSINSRGDIAGWGSLNGSTRAFLLLAQPGACYPNCDGSTTEPVLNVADFSCFLQKFASGDPYANCDGSTTEPVLNVADFSCFLQKFAAGCR
jgi:probable HAF family extracellular repeat protein